MIAALTQEGGVEACRRAIYSTSTKYARLLGLVTRSKLGRLVTPPFINWWWFVYHGAIYQDIPDRKSCHFWLWEALTPSLPQPDNKFQDVNDSRSTSIVVDTLHFNQPVWLGYYYIIHTEIFFRQRKGDKEYCIQWAETLSSIHSLWVENIEYLSTPTKQLQSLYYVRGIRRRAWMHALQVKALTTSHSDADQFTGPVDWNNRG